MQTECLHFELGKTASDGYLIPTSAGLVSQLPTTTGLVNEATPFRKDLATAGPVEVLDYNLTNSGTVGVAGTILTPGTMQKIQVKAVQASADITISKHGLLIQFDTDVDHWGIVAGSTYAGANGAVCKPCHGAYPIDTVILKYDWFWVVWSGICYVAVANGDTVTQGAGVSCAGNGLAGAALAGDPIVGVANETVTGDGTEATDIARITVSPGLLVPPPAG